MLHLETSFPLLLAASLLLGCDSGGDAFAPDGDDLAVTPRVAALESHPNKDGVAGSAHAQGEIDRSGAFFQAIGALPNRTCEHCHFPEAGWSLTPSLVKSIFEQTDGLHPMFSTHDMGSRVDADVSTTDARRDTFETALKRGLTRFTGCAGGGQNPLCLPQPPSTDFDVVAVDDPTGFSTPAVFSIFRRPIPTANSSRVATLGAALFIPSFAIEPFSVTAANFHLFANPDQTQASELSAFQLGHVFAQAEDDVAGPLDADGAFGGPEHLLAQPFFLGINDPASPDFDSAVFDLYDAWLDEPGTAPQDKARRAIARGQEIFNTRQFIIEGVAGLNDALGQPSIEGTCGTCHNAPNVGSHSSFRFMNIGTADADRRWHKLPLFTFRNQDTGQTVEMADPGHAADSGLWADLGKFRVPHLRGLAARAPYLHDGSAEKISDVIDYHEDRFDIPLNQSDRKDLAAFLLAL